MIVRIAALCQIFTNKRNKWQVFLIFCSFRRIDDLTTSVHGLHLDRERHCHGAQLAKTTASSENVEMKLGTSEDVLCPGQVRPPATPTLGQLIPPLSASVSFKRPEPAKNLQREETTSCHVQINWFEQLPDHCTYLAKNQDPPALKNLSQTQSFNSNPHGNTWLTFGQPPWPLSASSPSLTFKCIGSMTAQECDRCSLLTAASSPRRWPPVTLTCPPPVTLTSGDLPWPSVTLTSGDLDLPATGDLWRVTSS